MEYLVPMTTERLDIYGYFQRPVHAKSTGGENYSWLLNTGGVLAPCPVTTTGGASSGGSTSTCSIPTSCDTMFCK